MANPKGFNTVTPTVILKDAAKAIDTYKKAFGAVEKHRMTCPESGKVMHACLGIGDSNIFLGDESPQCSVAASDSVRFYVYTDDVDSAFKKAKSAGLEEVTTPEDMFWGDRTGTVRDKWGVHWTLATHVRDVSEDEMKEAMKKMMEAA